VEKAAATADRRGGDGVCSFPFSHPWCPSAGMCAPVVLDGVFTGFSMQASCGDPPYNLTVPAVDVFYDPYCTVSVKKYVNSTLFYGALDTGVCGARNKKVLLGRVRERAQ